MNVMNPLRNNLPHRTLTAEQLDQILDAIVDGKYSWACILLLRSVGYNPLNYMPYRTYARIVKDNSARITDLSCLEPLEGQTNGDRVSQVRGGNGSRLGLRVQTNFCVQIPLNEC
jgi:hypothetical protein